MLRDADDSDAGVNTPASVIAKYGSIGAFLDHLGYSHTHIYYIASLTDPTYPGNDSTGLADSPTHPFATLKTGVMPKIAQGTRY